MAKKKVLKCANCKCELEGQVVKYHTARTSEKPYCVECYEEVIVPKIKQASDWDLLFQYICDLHDIDKPNGHMLQQIATYRKEPYNYSDYGMYCTLFYYYETLDNPVNENTGVGIIPYYYHLAKAHTNQLMRIEDKAMEFQQTKDKKIVKTHIRDRYKKDKLIDFSSVNWGEDDE